MSSFTPDRIRSFCIIAHVDHGKSTLADRLLEQTGAIDASGSADRLLDTLEVEQDRGITVKAMHASLVYTCTRREQEAAEAAELRQLELELLRLEAEDEGHGEAWLREQEARIEREHAQAQAAAAAVADERYLLNLIDTPGHVDFSHEVMRTLGACQSAVLLVDAVQGVQSQTVAVHAAARAAGLLIIPVRKPSCLVCQGSLLCVAVRPLRG